MYISLKVIEIWEGLEVCFGEQWPTVIAIAKPLLNSINTILLRGRDIHSFIYCLWFLPHTNKGVEWLQPRLAQKAKKTPIKQDKDIQLPINDFWKQEK